MLPLPEPVPFDVRLLDVGDGHRLHVEQVGRPDGIPAVFLHGGPGSGCRPGQRELFAPSRYRAVLFDQRGAGRSLAEERLAANTTADLIADIERIREALEIERWLVVGGSWGATLALAYAEAHPERVTGMALRAVFLGTRAELDWAFIDGPKRLRPDLFADFMAGLPESERDDPLPAYWTRILDPDPAVHGPAAWRWHDTERVLSEAAPARQRLVAPPAGGGLPASPFFEAHYFRNDCFLAPDQLLAGTTRLAGIPGIIVQGRYDLLCPPATSFALAAAWRGAEVRIVEAAGHAMTEPGITPALRSAIDELADLSFGVGARSAAWA
ncbi:MAG: prolyl aminopeptidase [Bauldia sp.]|nr:prolyl aminopeptidase [Bauldia sp.]